MEKPIKETSANILNKLFPHIGSGLRSNISNVSMHNIYNKIMLGNTILGIDDDDLQINGKTYKGTPGLYELIFMRRPSRTLYTKDDLQNYKTILNETNVHRRSYLLDGQISGNKGYKYSNILNKLFPHIGSGLRSNISNVSMQVTNNQKFYIYWDDPNELLDHLRLLIASQQAGHSNHNNEIISIIEELKESGIIE